MTKYFKNLPTISYNGYPAKNIVSLARLSEETLNNRTLFYPYTIEESDRPDIISNNYYDDPNYVWLVFLSNNIVDPYFDMPLDDYNFDLYIQKKYGSIANAQQTIAYYSNNWSIDESELSVSEYNALESYQKKYFQPTIDQLNNVISYVRKRDDTIASTNQTVMMSLGNTNGTFSTGEKVTQRYANGVYSANAFVSFANSVAMSVQHVTGEVIASNSSVILTLTGVTSGATANVTEVSVTHTIPENEIGYWSAVSYYDHEEKINSQKKEIYLLDYRYKGTAESEFKRIMKS